MTPFTAHRGVLVPFVAANVDTDQIVPARFLHRPRAEGYADQLFHDLRRAADGTARADFVLHDPAFRDGTILVAGPNFGCGSSREHAVWALADHGFRAVVAPSFGDIFFNNAIKNGLLPVVADGGAIERLAEAANARRGASARIDLPAQTLVLDDGFSLAFEIDPYGKEMLIAGASEIEMTLRAALAEIEAFESEHARRHAWALPGRLPPAAADHQERSEHG